MTRIPAIGRCKKRLSSSIGSVYATSIQKKLTIHTLAVAKELEETGLVTVQVALSGIGPNARKRWAYHFGLQLVEDQGHGALGLRMKRQFQIAQNRSKISNNNISPIIIIGSDLPSLCKRDLQIALHALKKKDIIIGPSLDGGYWLLGMNKKLLKPLVKWPFCGINWGSKEVLSETILKASARNISYSLLHEQNDIDIEKDLYRWQA